MCQKRFKVIYGQGNDKPVDFCPYCGHQGQQCWWTPEQAAYFRSVVSNQVVAPMLDDFAQKVNHVTRPGDLIQMKARVSHDMPAPSPTESDTDMPVVTFACCSERIKHDRSADHLYCIICGQLQGLAPSDV